MMNRDSIASVSTNRSSISKIPPVVALTANREVKIRLFTGNNLDESGKDIGVLKNGSANFKQKNYQSFQSIIQKLLRNSPSEPGHEIATMKIKFSDGRFETVDEDNFEAIRDDIMHLPPSQKVSMRIFAITTESSTVPTSKFRSPSRLKERLSAESTDENSSSNTRNASPGRAAFGTAPHTNASTILVNSAKSNPIASSPRRSVSACRGGDRGSSLLNTKAVTPLFNKKLSTGKLRPSSPTDRMRGSPANGISTPESAVRARARASSAARVSISSSGTALSHTPGGLVDRKVKRVTKVDRSSPKTSPVKIKREASSDTIESEASVDSGADELQQKLEELAIAQDEPDQEAVVEDTGDEKSAVNQQSDGEGVFQEQDAKDDPCKDHKLQTEDDIQVDLSPSLTFDLSPSEEEPDMGHNVWRESIVYTSHRGQEIDKIEKKLEFGEEENIDAAETETKIEGDSTAPAVSEEPEETSEDCQPDTDTGAGNDDNDPTDVTDNAEIEDVSEEETHRRHAMDKSIPAFARPTAASAKKVTRIDPVKKAQKKPVVSSRPTPAPRTASNTAIKTPSKTITDLPTSPEGSASKLMLPTASWSAADEESARQREKTKKWEDSLRGPDPAPKKDKSKTGVRGKGWAYNPQASILKAMREDTKTLMPDGRPSIDTMSAQWEFMRDQFLGTNENLEWAMTAKQGGEKAYKLAHRKATIAEDQYYRAIFEIDMVELKMAAVRDSQIKEILEEMAACTTVLSKMPYDPESCALIEKNRATLTELFTGPLRGVFSKTLEDALKKVCEMTEAHSCARKADFVLQHSLPADQKAMKERLQSAHVASNESLAEMEKWSTREKETSQYSIVMAEEDSKWMMDNSDKNMDALELMRSIIPQRVAEMSLKDIQEHVAQQHGLYTPELIAEIKTNKLLHWLVTHTDDIAFSNFLSGEHRQYFVNLEGLDVVELRALRLVIPDKFELDSDGAKAEWRERFVSRVKQLVSQENGDMIKGGWDAEMGNRAMVRLPALKEDQSRRSIYFYRTKAQMEKRLKQYDEKDALLLKKEQLLSRATAEAADMRQEYDIILEETRDPAMKSVYGAEKLAAAKDCAKRDWQAADRRKNELNMEVMRLQKSISSNPISREQFVTLMREQGEFLAEQNWAESETPILINGVFDRHPEIKKIERSAAKFMSAEQEAMQRKRELDSMSSGVTEETVVEAVAAEVPALSSVDGVEEVAVSVEESKAPEAKSNAYLAAVNASKLISETPAPPSAGKMRRNSVLAKANPDMLNVLNAMLLGGQKSETPVTPSRRASVSMTPFKGQIAGDATTGAEESTPLEAKPIRSRNLKRILEMGEGGGRASMNDMRPQLSFLDQLKQGKKRNASANDVSESVQQAAPNFLDAIKARRKAIEETTE